LSAASRTLAAWLALAASASPAGAAGWEIAASAGKVFPFYNQAFEYDPGALAPPITGATLEQRGVFMLDARGGLALNLALARDLGRHVALEARLDTADVSVSTIGARYRLRANLPAPLPPLSTDVDLGTGSVDLERLRPLSLDLKLQGGQRPRVAVSAGVSWLPGFRFVVNQAIGIGLPGLSGSRLALDVARVGLTAEALPSERGQGRLGGNVGMSIGFPLGQRLTLVLDGRYFRFQKQTLHWGRAQPTSLSRAAEQPTGALPAIQESLVRQVESKLEPVVFNPTFFHASVGMALRF
jgi:hypothetical protein